MSNKTKNILNWVPSIFIALFITMSASFKITALPLLVAHFTELHLVQYLKLFGIAELLFIVLFLNRKTMRIGCLLLTAYFGGAIAVELTNGGNMVAPVMILTIIWVAASLRKPGIFKDMSPQKQENTRNESLQLS